MKNRRPLPKTRALIRSQDDKELGLRGEGVTARATADPYGMTTKEQTTAKANAGASTASFAKCANDFAQDDKVWVVGGEKG